MKRTKGYIALIMVGVIILAAGFIPLTRETIVTEEKIKEEIEYREETKTREEVYTEEEIVGTELKEEVLLRESVPVVRSSTMGKTFELTAGDIVRIKAHSDDTMMLSFTGQGDIYMSLEMGTDIEKEFTIEKDGEHTLLYSPASVTKDIVIDFDIVRVYSAPVVEEVEKTRTVEYTEDVPYTKEVPYTEQVTKEEKYTVGYLKYAGIGVIIAGVALFIWESQKRSKLTSKRQKKKKQKQKKKKKK